MAVDPATLAGLAALDTATVYEASGLDCACEPELAAVWVGAKVCGPAFTVECRPGDNLALHRALDLVEPGQVLAVQAHGFLAGHWGEILAVAAQERGVAGLVIEGGLRDLDALRERGFPAFSTGRSVRRTTKHDPGVFGGQIRLGGVAVDPGDVILGDTDGVVVVPADHAAEILAAGRDRAEAEADYFRRLGAGESTLDIYGFR